MAATKDGSGQKKKRKNNDPKKPQTNLRKKARRDIRVAYDPVLDGLKRARQQTEREYEQDRGRMQDIMGELGAALAPLMGAYDTQAQAISGDLNASLGSLAGLLGQGADASATGLGAGEAGAASNLFSTLGAGGQTLLSSDRMRNLGYGTSLARQVPLQQMAEEKRLLQERQDLLDDLRAQKQDLVGRMPGEILAHLDTLRQTRRQNELARAELALREQIADRQMKFNERQANRDNRQENRTTNFARTEAERRRDARQIRPIRSDIASLRDIRSGVRNQIEGLGAAGGPEASINAQKAQQLRRRDEKLTSKIRKKKRRIRKIRRN